MQPELKFGNHPIHLPSVRAFMKATLQQFPLPPEQQYAIRRMRADESEQVSQLMERTCGNTYFNEDVYYPDRVVAQNERTVVLSYVAAKAS